MSVLLVVAVSETLQQIHDRQKPCEYTQTQLRHISCYRAACMQLWCTRDQNVRPFSVKHVNCEKTKAHSEKKFSDDEWEVNYKVSNEPKMKSVCCP